MITSMKVHARLRNAKTVFVCFGLLGLLARWMKPATTVRAGNVLLSWLKAEYRVDGGEWQSMDHGTTMRIEDGKPTIVMAEQQAAA